MAVFCRVAAACCSASIRAFSAEAPGVSATSVESQRSSSMSGKDARLFCTSGLSFMPARICNICAARQTECDSHSCHLDGQ